MKKGVFLLLIIIISAGSDHSIAQQSPTRNPFYHFHRLDESDGLSNNVINDIIQDKVGFIWIATEDGLFRWFLRAAKARGVNQFIGFVNSPPVYLTKNGKAYSSNSQSLNLPIEN